MCFVVLSFVALSFVVGLPRWIVLVRLSVLSSLVFPSSVMLLWAFLWI